MKFLSFISNNSKFLINILLMQSYSKKVKNIKQSLTKFLVIFFWVSFDGGTLPAIGSCMSQDSMFGFGFMLMCWLRLFIFPLCQETLLFFSA